MVYISSRPFRQELPNGSGFFLGESLVGEGNEVAHIDLIIGSKTGPAGAAFCNALTNNKDGFTTLLAVVAPNLPAKPDTILFNKVTIKGAKQAVQMFGPAQAAVARAVVDSVESGVIPKDKAEDYCVMVGVFIHWEAADDKKIYDYNYQATKESIERALADKPTVARSHRRLEDGQASLQPQVTSGAARVDAVSTPARGAGRRSLRSRSRSSFSPSHAQTSPATRHARRTPASSTASSPTTAARTRS